MVCEERKMQSERQGPWWRVGWQFKWGGREYSIKRLRMKPSGKYGTENQGGGVCRESREPNKQINTTTTEVRCLEGCKSDNGFESTLVSWCFCAHPGAWNDANSRPHLLSVGPSAICGFYLLFQIEFWWWEFFVCFCALSEFNLKMNGRHV